MKKNYLKAFELLRFNWKIIVIFEIIYRLFGIVIIFPLSKQLLSISIKLTGSEYIINRELSAYISSPSTIFISILLFFIVGIYITYEAVVLSMFFHCSYYKQKTGIYALTIASFKKIKLVLKKYHIFIVFSSMIFFFIVNGLHIVGIVSTIKIPTIIFELLSLTKWFYPSIILAIIIISVLFVETIFFELQCTIESTSIKDNFTHSRSILKKKRSIIVFEFLGINFVLNIFLYIIYFILIGLVGLMILLFKGDSIVYPFILTGLYMLYLVIGFIATITLIPINFAWISVWYYQHKKTIDFKIEEDLREITDKRPFSIKAMNRITGIILLILVVLVASVFTSIKNESFHLELFSTPSVISHRGGGKYAPENTLSAIEKGIELGADFVEIDVRYTKDGIPILMHDPNVGRTTNDVLNRRVDSLTLKEIKLLDAGSWFSEEYAGEKVPTLVEAIDKLDKNVEMLIELKTNYTGAADIIVNIIETASVESQVKIISFDSELLKEIKMINDKIETILLIGLFIGDISALTNNEYLDYFGFNYEIVRDNTQYIELIHSSGKGVYVWTVDDETAILEMITLNVNGIITDSPLLTRELVHSDSIKTEFTKLLETLFKRD